MTETSMTESSINPFETSILFGNVVKSEKDFPPSLEMITPKLLDFKPKELFAPHVPIM
jgi:hypothetical protein